jgi:hypothetical protein
VTGLVAVLFSGVQKSSYVSGRNIKNFFTGFAAYFEVDAGVSFFLKIFSRDVQPDVLLVGASVARA